jgi:RNA polymerase sigma factor (sigma-70 family)
LGHRGGRREATPSSRASAAGDRTAFAGIYDRYGDRLHDFCAGMLGDRDGAADCVQDAFCIAATRLPQLRDPDKLRPWLYSIARNEALRRIRDRRRETPSEDLPDEASGEPGPDTLAARTELADLIADAAGGLSDRDRSVLELAFRHGLSGPDLAEALDVSPGTANTIVQTAARHHRTIPRRSARISASAQQRRLSRTGRDPRRLGWTLQCPYAQTHLAAHRVV